MAIYKLGSVISFSRGGASFQKKDLLFEGGEFIALHYGKTYKVSEITSEFKWTVNNNFFKESSVILKGDVFMITTSETRSELGHPVFYNNNKTGLLGGEQIKLINDESILLNKYLYYWLSKNQQKWKRFATGLSVFRMKGNDLSFVDIDIPTITDQQKIIDIIKPIEDTILTINKVVSSVEELISRLPKVGDARLGGLVENKRNKKKMVKQVSAKVLAKRSGILSGFEDENTYKTNTFNVKPGYIVINTIRPYLEKFGVIWNEFDATGTMVHLEVKNNFTSVIRTLLSNDFWSEMILLSKGTKMPVVSKEDILNAGVSLTNEISGLKEFYIKVQKLMHLLEKQKKLAIKLLIN